MKLNTFAFLFIAFFFSLTSFAQEKLDVFEIARKGTVEELKLVLQQNPNEINNVNKDGYSPLILACYRENNEVAKLLIEKGANINFKSGLGTPLMACSAKGNLVMAKILIEKKADINSTDENGMSAIMYCVMFKNYEFAKLLIENKAKIEVKDNRGNSPLDYAILADDDKMIEILKSN